MDNTLKEIRNNKKDKAGVIQGTYIVVFGFFSCKIMKVGLAFQNRIIKGETEIR